MLFRKSVHPLLTWQYLNFSLTRLVHICIFIQYVYSQQDAFSTVFTRVMDAQQKREARLSCRRERERRNRASESAIAALQVSKCSTCLQRFPGLNVKPVFPDSDDTECVCHRISTSPRPTPLATTWILVLCHLNYRYMYMYVNARILVCDKNGTSHNLTLFNEVIFDLLEGIQGDNIKQRLMQVEETKFYVNNRGIAYSVKKV